jgi:hypothetical protein
MSNIHFIGEPLFNPKYVGAYWLGGHFGVGVHLERRPLLLHRLMMRWLLGWEWRDAP